MFHTRFGHGSSSFSALLMTTTLLATTWFLQLGIPTAAQETYPTQGTNVQSTLPTDNSGIAKEYPGDRGLSADDRVIFVESFDDDAIAAVAKRWESVQSIDLLSVVEDKPEGAADSRSLQVRHVGGETTGAHLYRQLKPGYDKLHYRFYVKFAEDCAPIHHFFHVGGYNPATAWPQGGAGVRPEADKRFTTGVEPFGEMWQWDFYSYWGEMGGSPPRGQTWGNSFVHDPNFKVEKDKWICVELMMKLNTVGESNGEMALWIDGKLARHIGPGFPKGKWIFDKFIPFEGGESVFWDDETGKPKYSTVAEEGEPFKGFRFRDEEDLNLNFLWLLCYITKAKQDHVSHIYFDQVVVATEYIGPIEPISE